MKDGKRLGDELLGHLQLYKDLGVRYVAAPLGRKKSGKPESRPAAASPQKSSVRAAAGKSISGKTESLEIIRDELGDCRRCKLANGRKNIVFGAGNPKAELMFVGEAPGADEDEQGLPFVGRAGQLLTKIIEAIQMKREDVFICNILKCRPPNNRNPEQDEIESCQPFLFRQIASVKPRVICALGTFGAQTLLQTHEPIGKLRGRLVDYQGIKLMATFHPAYLLRNPNEKRKVWEDVQIVRDYLRGLDA